MDLNECYELHLQQVKRLQIRILVSIVVFVVFLGIVVYRALFLTPALSTVMNVLMVIAILVALFILPKASRHANRETSTEERIQSLIFREERLKQSSLYIRLTYFILVALIVLALPHWVH